MQALGELIVRAYRALGDQAIDDDYAAELGDVGGRAAQVPVLVAVEDGRLLGGVTYVPGPGPFAEIERPDEAGIRMLAVGAEHEGRGAGQALVEECLGRAREAGKHAVVLLTTPRMHARPPPSTSASASSARRSATGGPSPTWSCTATSDSSDPGRRAQAAFVTKDSIRLGTQMTLATSRPSRWRTTFSRARAAATAAS